MKLTTKGRYAVMAMVDIAFYSDGDPMSMSLISERQAIPLPYLEQLFSKLRKAKLISSARGAKGGYILARDAKDINIADVILAVDEPLKITRCSPNSGGCMHKNARCMTHDLWEGLGKTIHNYLGSVSLADVCDKNEGKEKSCSYESFVEVDQPEKVGLI